MVKHLLWKTLAGLVLLFLFFFISCRKAPEVLLERVAGRHLPVFTDDLDRESLKAAAEKSLEFYRQKPAEQTLAFGKNTIAVKDLEASLVTVLSLLEGKVDLNRTIPIYFDVYRATHPVVFTGYYEPVLNGNRTRNGRYQYPLYRRPDDLIEIDLSLFLPDDQGKKLSGRLANDKLIPYFTRAEIDGEQRLSGKGYELAWVNDPVALFFLHIQGSGQIALEDGSRLRVGYAASNGRAFRSIGRLLVAKGVLSADNVSMQSVRLYLKNHPQKQREILFRNQRYIFFRPVPDGPQGSTGVSLTPGRSIAIDPRVYPAGALAFIQAQRPIFNAAQERVGWQPFSRFVLAQDSGAAITGPGRADLFCGNGEEAELVAGHMGGAGEIYFLVKKPEEVL
jgi:membrane-bound lytic murein transglycosylase A